MGVRGLYSPGSVWEQISRF